MNLEFVCKTASCFIILISASFHLYRLFRSDHSGKTCLLLFTSGQWIGKEWQPDGCMMHDYTVNDARFCLRNQRVAFIGDSRMRNSYFQLANYVSATPVQTGKYHEDLFHKDDRNITINFYWRPTLDEDIDELLKKWMQKPSLAPDLIVIGVGTWTMKNSEAKYPALVYQGHLHELSTVMSLIGRNLSNRMSTKLHHETFYHREPQLIWLQQDPVVEERLNEARKKITNEKINKFNYAAEMTLTDFIQVIKSTALMAAGKPNETEDGLHYSDFIQKKKMDVILNSFCNNYIFPDDASCCKDLESATHLQFNAFAVLCTCVLLWALMYVCRKIRMMNIREFNEEQISQYDSFSTAPWLYQDQVYVCVKCMAKLAIIMLYVFLADSSFLYNKWHKHYTHVAVLVPMVAMVFVGLIYRRDTTSTVVLEENQLNEWKGWMICVIMLYNYTGAEEILPFFVNVRLLYSFFLFLLGFTHFKYLWYTENFDLYRVCKVVAHMNVFCVVVCLVMGHTYQYYMMVPMLTVWFVVIYFFMLVKPRSSHKKALDSPKTNVWMIAKFAVMLALIIVVWAKEAVCDWVFSQLMIRELFIGSNGTVDEWRVNSSLHRFAVFFGMITSYVYVTLKRHNYFNDEDNNAGLLSSAKLNVFVFCCSVVAFAGYQVHAFSCPSKPACDRTHSALSFIPIIALVLMRNLHGRLRTTYSVFLAWMGNMSLELFIGHYHIWLSNDSHGVHVLVPWNMPINAVVTTFTFLCIIHEVKKICSILADTLVSKDVMVMLWRLCLFVVMLVLIWWHKTHEIKPRMS